MSQRNFTAPRRSRLSAALLAAILLPTAGLAFAQDASEETEEETTAPGQATDLDRVSVVGSRIKRTELEGPAPVTVITRADIDAQGFQTVGDMLQTLSQNTTSSFTGDLGVTGFTPNAQVVNLRNLGPGYTLTLINGRRPAQYPQPYNRDNNVVNIRAIPSSAIERVEVLTGGASAIYGSDAVAGVVNIVLRENFDGNSVRLTAGTTANGGGDSVNFEYTGGRTGDRWSTTYAFQYGNSEPVFASQRDFLADTRNGPLGFAFTNPALSLIAIRGTASPGGTVSGPGPANTNAFYPGADVCDRFGYTTVTTAARGNYCGSFTQPSSRSQQNKNQFYSAYGYATFDVTDDLQLFGSATYYKSDAAATSGTEFWGTSGDPFNRLSTGGTSAFYYDPQFGSVVQLQRVFNPFELGGNEASVTKFDEETYDVMGGLQGTLGERFNWEALAAYSHYDYVADRPRLLAQPIHDYFLGPNLGFANTAGVTGLANSIYPIHRLNLVNWTTPFTPEQYAAVSTRVLNIAESSSATASFSMSGDLFELPAGSVGFAGVLEAVRQTTDLQSDPRLNPLRPRDSQTVYNLVSSGRTEGERDRYAAGVEFRVPILDSLTAQLAGRYDKYDDITAVDAAFTQMYGLEWRPLDNLLLRGSFATSFRAPDMQLVYAEGAASFAAIFDQYACRAGFGPGQAGGPRPVAQCGATDPTRYQTQTTIAGNPLLKEEEGESMGAGFVWDIADGMSLSVDYYRIKLEDQSTQLSAAFLLENEASCYLGTYPDGRPYPNALDSAFCQNIIGLITRQSAPGTALDGRIERINSAYINAALSDTSGIDANYRYRFDTDRMGRFFVDLGYSLVLTDKYKQFADQELIDYRDVPGRNSRSRARGTVGWERNDWSATVFGTRYGSVRNSLGNAGGVNAAGEEYGARLAPYMLYNLQVGKKFGDSVRTTFTVVNVLDNQYRYDASATGYPFYDPYVGADPAGRRFNFSIDYRF